MPEPLDALRQAAVTLLAAASPGAVLAATRALLADWDENILPAVGGKPLQDVRHGEEQNGVAAPAPPPAGFPEAPEAIPVLPPLAGAGAGAGAAHRAQMRAAEKAWFAPPAKAPDSAALAEWEELRQRVREARQERGVSIQDLAEQLGLAKTTLENALQCRALPSGRMRQNLEQWLAAPEVAADETMFRGNGASRTAGSDNTPTALLETAPEATCVWEEHIPLDLARCDAAMRLWHQDVHGACGTFEPMRSASCSEGRR
jgi:transcriptional regulator with XRE-family HTH domain